MRTYYAYVRVSTTRQGEEGVSLREQRRAILEYASIRCERCKLCASGQVHKGHTYYRCPTKACSCIREECFETAVVQALKRINTTPNEQAILEVMLRKLKEEEAQVVRQLRRAAETELERVQQAIKILLQKFLDNNISKEIFDDGHVSLLVERKVCEEKLGKLNAQQSIYPEVQAFVTSLNSLCERFCTGTPELMRVILDEVFKEITTAGKVIHLNLSLFMEQIANREKTTDGWRKLLPVIAKELVTSQKFAEAACGQ